MRNKPLAFTVAAANIYGVRLGALVFILQGSGLCRIELFVRVVPEKSKNKSVDHMTAGCFLNVLNICIYSYLTQRFIISF